MAVLGLRFCARAFSSCGKWGPLFIAVHGPLTIAASLVAEHKLQMRRLSICGSRAQLLRGMWDLPRPGLEPVSPTLAGGFSTTAPPGKPRLFCFVNRFICRHWLIEGIKDDFHISGSLVIVFTMRGVGVDLWKDEGFGFDCVEFKLPVRYLGGVHFIIL